MKIEARIILNSEELYFIPYRELCEVWGMIDTFSAKRKLESLSLTKEMLKPLHKKALKWHLHTMPHNAEFTPQELAIWIKVSKLIPLL